MKFRSHIIGTPVFLLIIAFGGMHAQTGVRWLKPARDAHLRIVQPASLGNVFEMQRETTLVVQTDPGIDMLAGWENGKVAANDRSILIEKIGGRFVVRLAPTQQGSGNLILYVGKVNGGDNHYTSAVNIPMFVHEVYDPPRPFPHVLPAFRRYNVGLVDGYRGFIRTAGEISLRFACPHNLILFPSLIGVNGIALERAAIAQPLDTGYIVKAFPPYQGTFTLSIAVRPSGKFGDPFDGIVDYTIEQPEDPVSVARYPEFLNAVDEYLIDYDVSAFASEPAPPRAYSAIDEWARSVPPDERQSLDTLVQLLVRPAHDDFEKARAIYVWITENIAYAFKAYQSGKIDERVTGWQGVVRSRQGVCQGYTDLVRAMAQRAGLEVVMVTGRAKGFGYKVENRSLGGTHAWNALKLDGKWYLMDATWGAGYIRNMQYEKSFNTRYFLPLPDDMICDHFPELQHYQFLSKPVTLEEWKRRKCEGEK